MRRIILVAALLAAGTCQAQISRSIQPGLRAGVTGSTLSGVQNAATAPLIGFVVGPTLRTAPTRDNLTLQVEALLNTQGARLTRNNGTDNVNLTYLTVPVLLRQYLDRILFFNGGVQAGLLLGNQHPYRAVDFALAAGGGVELPHGLTVEARLSYGLTDLTKGPVERLLRQQAHLEGLYNRSAQLTVGYSFGDR